MLIPKESDVDKHIKRLKPTILKEQLQKLSKEYFYSKCKKWVYRRSFREIDRIEISNFIKTSRDDYPFIGEPLDEDFIRCNYLGQCNSSSKGDSNDKLKQGIRQYSKTKISKMAGSHWKTIKGILYFDGYFQQAMDTLT